VGKTSVSRLLALKLDAVHIELGRLVEQKGLFVGIDEIRGTLIADLKKVSGRVQEIIGTSNKDVLVEGHYAVDVVPKENINHVFVLRRDPVELKQLMESRGFEGDKLWENLAVEILDVCLYDAVSVCGCKKVCELDVSGKAVDEVVEEMLTVLNGRKDCGVGIVDWLGKLEKLGCLEVFLRNNF
jgi:adenylate kinase